MHQRGWGWLESVRAYGERGLVHERRHSVPRLWVQAKDDLDFPRVRAAWREQRRYDAVEACGDLRAEIGRRVSAQGTRARVKLPERADIVHCGGDVRGCIKP